jgi:hypothetical protein
LVGDGKGRVDGGLWLGWARVPAPSTG